MTQHLKPTPTPQRRVAHLRKWRFNGLTSLIATTIVLGLFFRFAGFSERPYWHDEAHTLLRASGRTIAELTQTLFQGQVITVDQLQQFQTVSPNKSWIDTISSTATEDQPLTPLYYLLVHFWEQGFGNSVVAVRTLSSLINLLAFPCIYWLSLELFTNRLTGLLAMGLFAVSPFQAYYSSEVRAYSLWTVLILLMHLALVRAMTRPSPRRWMWYTIATALSLYTNIFSCFIMLGHGLYVVAIEHLRLTRRLLGYGIASLAALLAFSPWLVALVARLDAMKASTAWMNQPLPLKELTKSWILNFESAFFRDYLIPGRLQHLALVLAIALVGYSLFILCGQTTIRVWLLILTMILPIPLYLGLQDVLLGGIRSTNSRYFFPVYLGIHLTVAYLFASRLTLDRPSLWQQRRWKLIVAMLFTVGSLSCLMQLKRGNSSTYQSDANLINQFENPLVISHELSYRGGGTLGDVLALSHLLDSDVQFQLVIDPAIPKIPDRFKQVFLYKPTPDFNQKLGLTYQLKALSKSGLWQLVKPPSTKASTHT